MEYVVMGGLGAAALYMLKKPGFNDEEGTLKEAVDYADIEGIVKPNGTLGDLNSSSSLTQQMDMETEELNDQKPHSRADFIKHFYSAQGEADYMRWMKQQRLNPTLQNTAQYVRKYEMFWRTRNNCSDSMQDKVRRLQQRNTLNAAVVSTNAFDPDRLTQVRNRPTATPYVAEFATSNTQITGHPTYLDVSPYTLTNYDAIPETPYASDRTGVRTSRDTHVDITPVVATAAPTQTTTEKVGAVRFNMGNLHRMASTVRAKASAQPDNSKGFSDPAASGRHKRVLTAH